MKIAVLSGKGGAGKTTIAVNLSMSLGCNYADLDVEEPNGALFLNPDDLNEQPIYTKRPRVDSEKCTLCGACSQACQFNACLVSLDRVLVFDELCHNCGACKFACPADAIEEVDKPLGNLTIGTSKRVHGKESIQFVEGKLNIGEPMAGPVIEAVGKHLQASGGEIYIMDCAPGASCNVVKALKFAEFAVLVTEPTVFGLHDFKVAHELVKEMKIPCGVIINRSQPDKEKGLLEYINKEDIPIIGRVPYSRHAAEIYSSGHLLIEDIKYKNVFDAIGRILCAHIERTKKAGARL